MKQDKIFAHRSDIKQIAQSQCDSFHFCALPTLLMHIMFYPKKHPFVNLLLNYVVQVWGHKVFQINFLYYHKT